MNKNDGLFIAGYCLFFIGLVYGGLWLYNSMGSTAIAPMASEQPFGQPDLTVSTGSSGESLPQNSERSVRFLFFGDMMLDRHVGERIAERGLDYLFEGLATSSGLALSGYDLVSANLEGAVTDGGAHYPPANAYDFAFAPELVGQLEKYNFNFFNLANNHFADQGERGITETYANLDRLGYGHSGCADRRIADCSTAIREINGTKVGLAGYSMVYGTLDPAALAASVRTLADTADLVIVNMHWGTEYEHSFGRIQQKTAHALADAGADLIIGHHPHVVQGAEIYETVRAEGISASSTVKVPIFYSLGNFIFDQYFSADTQEGLAVSVIVNTEGMELELTPLTSKSSRPELMTGNAKAEFLEKFIGWSDVETDHIKQISDGFLSL